MMRRRLIIPCFWIPAFLAFAGTVSSQDPPRKPPKLIRDTGVAEGKTDAETAKKKEFNPMLAEENLQIGNFYYKRGNYPAALERYRDAVEYQPNLIAARDAMGRAVERLGRDHEKKRETDKALALYKEFLALFPDAPKSAEFKSKIASLEKK